MNIETFTPVQQAEYKDDDLVYVDPDKREVIGLVQWSNSGKPKPLLVRSAFPEPPAPPVVAAPAPATPAAAPAEDPKRKGGRKPREGGRPVRQRFYPWGTYRSMKKIFKVAGKIHEERRSMPLEEAIERCQNDPFWD